MIDISSIAEKFIQKEREKKSPSSENPSNNQNINSSSPKNNLNRNSFKFLYVIGKGGFGKVWKIQSKKTKIVYALKEMSKLKIIDKKSEKSINTEREFLSKLSHPFIVNMHYAFQDKQNLYLVMDILNGGDLRYHISRYRKFSEEQTRFFIANIIYSLQYIHSNNVIHRDIKPENLVLDEKGYVRITDFGIAKENMEDNSSETSGTPGYMAPEVMKARHHSFAVDFFALGVIGYEFMLGKRPYYGKNRKEIKEQMLAKQALITEDILPKDWSNESMDFINSLLQRKESKRLGYKGGMKGSEELMKHIWLRYYPWHELKNKTLLAPFIPDPKDNFDKVYCESVDKISEETQIRYEEIYVSSHFKKAFNNFFYNEDEPEEKARKEKIEKEREDMLEKERLKELEEEKETEIEIENAKKKEKEKEERINVTKKDNYDMNKKIVNVNNKTSTNFYKLDKNINSNITNQKKKITPSENISAKKIPSDAIKKKGNKIKTLSYSNSTRDIYSDKGMYKNINNYNSNNFVNNNKKKQYPIPVNNINYIQNNKKLNKNNSNVFTPPFSKGANSNTNININNYYLNNIFSSIHNNYMTNNANMHANYYSKNNNEIQKKLISNRSSSVINSKKTKPKINIFERKNMNKNNNINNYKSNSKVNNNYSNKNNIPKRRINKINENVVKSPSANEYFFNKIK